jgi:MFS family permease
MKDVFVHSGLNQSSGTTHTSGLPSGLSPEQIPALNEDFAPPRKLRPRSGLAFAAGFAALAFISGYSVVALIFDLHWRGAISDTTFFMALPLPRLPALFALWFGILAVSDLKRYKKGWPMALFGLTIGFCGTLIWLFETFEVATVFLRHR